MEIKKIILCGKRCTGKTTLFWDLQKSLNWPVFSISEYIRNYLHRYNLRSTDEIAGSSDAISRDFDERVDNLLISSDHVIIDARVYGKIRNPIPNTLKVLLWANDAVRVKRAAYRERTSEEVQQKKLLKREADWIAKMQVMYPFDFFDPQYYSVAIETSDKTPQQVLDEVLSYLLISIKQQ